MASFGKRMDFLRQTDQAEFVPFGVSPDFQGNLSRIFTVRVYDPSVRMDGFDSLDWTARMSGKFAQRSTVGSASEEHGLIDGDRRELGRCLRR
jgi:hypothetical protein